MIHDATDITIIGAGPTGLFAAFYAGMRGASARIIDALAEPGGQVTALYPEKYIFDVAGIPKILGKDLVRDLVQQTAQFQPVYRLGERVIALEEDGGQFVLVTAREGSEGESEGERYPTRSILIAAGIGAFAPRRLPQRSAEPWYGRGIYDRVTDPEAFRGKNVLLIGGGDSAFDWAQQLVDRAASLTQIHRSDRFRAHAATVRDVGAAAESGQMRLLTFHELEEVHGEDDCVVGATIKGTKTKASERVACDVILPMLGFVSDMSAMTDWGIALEKDEILVNSQMETGRPGIYAAGDVATYPGKLKLIATGFAEAAVAVNQAVHWIYPDKKVAPGHSSNMAIFGQSE